MKKNEKKVKEVYKCECGLQFQVWRLASDLRPKNHKKNFYCVQCRAEKNFVKMEVAKTKTK